jgi:isopentenyldiphosphate isomerase
VRQRGTLTLPVELCDKYGIRSGNTFRLVDLDGVFVLTPMVPMVPELAREIERMREEAGLHARADAGAYDTPPKEAHIAPLEYISRLRAQTTQADHCLTPSTYHEIRRLFEACASDPSTLDALRARAPEYAGREFLLNIDEQGEPVHPTPPVLAGYRRTLRRHPAFALWLEERRSAGRPLLLVSRWLCHLAGFRHRTVQLFLDHPAADGYTLLQVRGFDKAEAPGCFDTPCAGHVTALQSLDEALLEELAQELGLDRSDLSPPEFLGRYQYRDAIDGPTRYNVELRTVHRSRLLPGALSRIRFLDREVAALALFAASEVEPLLDTAPDRVASGLAASWPLYLRARPHIRPAS